MSRGTPPPKLGHGPEPKFTKTETIEEFLARGGKIQRVVATPQPCESITAPKKGKRAGPKLDSKLANRDFKI